METNNSSRTDDFICTICNKSYKNKSGIWKHNNNYHNNLQHNIPQKTQNLELNRRENTNNGNSAPQNTTKMRQSKSNECKFCNKVLSRYDSLKRHEQKCNFNNVINSSKNKDEIITMLTNTVKQQSEEIKHVKTMLMDIMNKNCKVHPKTLQKINKQLNGDNNTINENNGTVTNNITYNIIGLGHENLTEVFSKKEKMNILKYRFNSLPQLVEYAHFNDKYPQFKNILITNTQNTLAYKYDTKKKQFVAVNKEELLDDIVDERMCDINSFYEELENDLDEKTKEILDKVKDKIESDPNYKELKKKDIKLIIYNNRKKVIKENTNEIEL